MLLSACVLMKGETPDLRRIATMVQGLADELVVVGDAPVAEAFQAAAIDCGARLVPHHWQNDFAAARNAGLHAARGEWVFWIDSDETLLAPEPAAFRSLLEKPGVLGYYVNIEDQAGQAAMSTRQHLSLYRRRAEIRYFGRVHEHFEPPMEKLAAGLGLTVSASPVRLSHTGYQPEQRAYKLQRNIALLELELAERPGQLYYLIELGRSLLLAGQPCGLSVLTEAARVLRPTLTQPRSPNPLAAALLEYSLSQAPADFPLSRETAAKTALRWFPRSPPLLWLVARLHYQRRAFAEAARLLQLVLEMGETKNYDNTISFDQRIFEDEARLNFAVCCAKLGRTRQALEQLKRIPAGSPFFAMAQQNLELLAKR